MFVTDFGLASHIYEGGDEVDIEKLYRDYFAVVYRYILSISKDPLTAEEITQETFFKALKKIDDFRGDSSIKVWLCQIAKNAYFDYAKHQKRHTEFPEHYGEQEGCPEANVEEALISASDYKEVHRIIHNLKEPYKEVFSLRTFGELSFGDIGELFGKSDSWARVTYHRAKLMIKEEIRND